MADTNTSVKIGHARGVMEDRDNDLAITNWYCNEGNMAWTAVVRAIDSRVATALSAQVLYACNNDNIIYSQEYRDELYNTVKSGIAIQNISTQVHCDCTSLIVACLLAAGIDLKEYIGSIPYSGNIISAINKTGKFNVYSDIIHTQSASGLLVGDILIRRSGGSGHAAIVCYSEYDKNTTEYKDVPLSERTINYGRKCVQNKYVCNGITLPRDSAPSKLEELSDIELFLLGASITANESLFINSPSTNKGVISARNL